ncbi:MAG: S9 family peptidase [Candidatus Eremiobacteraeota bacterium]|nr:S9 family peptidase [Candidatus Eremiobacteraeota bacterium]
MPWPHRRMVATLLAMLAMLTVPTESHADLPTLIPRAVLFGNPEKASPTISPDGRLLAYLAPDDKGVLAIWVRSIGKTDDRLIASDPGRPIRNVYWQPDSRHVLFEQDRNGDENTHVYQTDVDGKHTRDLTPYEGVKASIDSVDPKFPHTLLVDMNKRDRSLFDVHRIDLKTGADELDVQNPGNVSGWVADNGMQIRAALARNSDASSTVLVRDQVGAPWRPLANYPADDGFAAPQAFSADDKSLYVSTAFDFNAARLLRYDVQAGTFNAVVSDPTFDVGGVLVDAHSRDLIAANVQRERSEWVVLDDGYAADFNALRALHAGDLSFTSQSADGQRLVVAYVVDNGPVNYYEYDRRTKTGTFLFTSRPQLEQYTLASMLPVRYAARDGMTIHAYLTLPAGVAPKDLPMVLFVHGGPWARDSWGFNPWVQWLANRGYAVLQPNFRGSVGFGKAFLNAGDRQWAGAMHDDLLDAKAWAVAQGYADPKRVCIMGGSYGGYATLAALAFSPAAFACGVDIVGPSNLNTLLGSIPAYWKTERSVFTKRMGEDEAFLNAQSPLFKADQITAPLLIGQGLHDPRVNVRESDQIVAALRAKHKDVEYIVFPDEGHGFARPENNRRFIAASEAFLAKYLGGRLERVAPSEAVDAFVK